MRRGHRSNNGVPESDTSENVKDFDKIKCECGKYFLTPFDYGLHRHIWHDGGAMEPFTFPGAITKYNSTAPLNERVNLLRNARLKALTFEGEITEYKDSQGNEIDLIMDEYADVWLRRPDGTMRKICAAKKRLQDAICLQEAGFGTNHLHTGRCMHHDRAESLPQYSDPSITPLSSFLLPHMLQDGHSLKSSFERISQISNKELFDLETPLRTAYALLDHQLTEGGQVITCPECGQQIRAEFTAADLDDTRKTLRLIDRLIRSDADIRAKLIVDPMGMWYFVEGIMDVAMQYVPKQERMEFCEAILQRVVMPLGDTNRLTLHDIDDGKKADSMFEVVEGDN